MQLEDKIQATVQKMVYFYLFLVLSEDFQWQDTDHIFLSLSKIPEISPIQYTEDTDKELSYAKAPELIVSEHIQRTSVNTDTDRLPSTGLTDKRKPKPVLFCSDAT